MNFAEALKSKSKLFYIAIMSLGIINSFVYSGILIFINHTISGTPMPYIKGFEAIGFIGLLVLSFVSNRIFRKYMVQITNSMLFEFEVMLIQKIRNASLSSFEKIGTEKVYTVISDMRLLARAPELFIEAINSAIIIICGVGYMFINSTANAFSVLALMIGLLVIYLVRNRDIEKDLSQLRNLQDDYYRYLNDLLNGFKEIKMSNERNNNLYHEYLKSNLETSKNLSITTSNRYTDNELIGTYSWYLVIALIVFVLPQIFAFSLLQITAFVVTILYLMRPVAILVGILPFYNTAKIGLSRINAFSDDLKNTHEQNTKLEENTYESFSKVSFKDVVYEYSNQEHERVFGVGPLNLTVNKGEIVFITGGNGSGKSTFINLLIGLFDPQKGSILLDETALAQGQNLSNIISVIFTSPHLFSENYDRFVLNNQNRELMKYIYLMKMEDVISHEKMDGSISTRLSKGQQKRLAMIYALLENRPILVLDEWAAEQDPEFRAYFYQELLPIFKAFGKTIIAVSHDDNYFHVADRLIKFDFGTATEISSVVKIPKLSLQYN